VSLGVTLRCLAIWPAVDKMLQEADVAKPQFAVNCRTVEFVWYCSGGGGGGVGGCKEGAAPQEEGKKKNGSP
jgi:hypothetical protein